MKFKNKEQVNISLPLGWKEELEKLARKISFERDETLTYLDLMREAIGEKYNLEYVDDEKT